jgi:hypothetical protein
LVIEYVFQDFVGKCRTIAFKHLRTERRAVCIFAAFCISEHHLAIAMLVGENLPWPPFHRKLGADTAMPAPLAIKIAAPFPRYDRRQMPRLQRGYLPLLGRKIGNPRKPHFSVRQL